MKYRYNCFHLIDELKLRQGKESPQDFSESGQGSNPVFLHPESGLLSHTDSEVRGGLWISWRELCWPLSDDFYISFFPKVDEIVCWELSGIKKRMDVCGKLKRFGRTLVQLEGQMMVGTE